MKSLITLAVTALVSWAAAPAYSQSYNLKTVETVTGTVKSIATVDDTKGRSTGGVHVLLAIGEKEDETVMVHLGPATFLKAHHLEVELDDVLEVTGSRVTIDDVPTILAARVQKGDTLVILRDPDGRPKWRRGGGPRT